MFEVADKIPLFSLLHDVDCVIKFDVVALLTSIRQLATTLRGQLSMLFQTHSRTWSA